MPYSSLSTIIYSMCPRMLKKIPETKMQKQAVQRTVCAWWFTEVAYLKTNNNKTLSLVSGNEDKSTDNRQEMLSLVGSVSSCSEMHLVGLNDGLLTFPKMATGPSSQFSATFVCLY